MAPAEGEYLVREIAGALVDIGRGQTYTDAALRVRARANIGKTGERKDVINGQTVADWMADFVPAVAARHEQTRWPAVLVLDSSTFSWTDPLTTKSLALFFILAAYGYDKDGKNGRLWKLEASPSSDTAAWAEFLSSLPGKPDSIVCDQDVAIIGAINVHWGRWAAANLVHHCEHHLSERALAAFKSDKLDSDDPVRTLFHGAFTSREKWDAFEAEITSRPRLLLTNSWLARNVTWMRGQTQGRSRIPPVYSNSAVEQPLREIRAMIRPRAFVFRNRARLNNVLILMLLARLRVDTATDYASDIRDFLNKHDGHPPRTYRATYDKTANADGEILLSSLWAPKAQLAMAEARAKKARARVQAREIAEAKESKLKLDAISLKS
ncbi:hypothetical protein [Cryobacterium sp. MDB2-33-2]|uniref:hypothetical protein n=1 Tax=Cryobacterium sp. MDB2-33-2 TaxID=1259179 RepID=UPI00106D0A53|nr:hypothetical protein [Cryobacterium sp. MDB2-33-2]TFC03259.1 hypothetical protein E3O59_16425 [Cryobacterium sp. MDB2-33-2]